MKIAIVHDDFMQWGGAERLVAALAGLFPDAPVYTSMLDEEVVRKSGIEQSRFVTNGLNRVPFKKKLNKVVFPLYPVFFEGFDFSSFDLVISSSTRFAHGVITKPTTQHIAYINSPFRGFWEPDLYFGRTRKGRVLKTVLLPILSYLRGWDFVAGQRPDVLIGNSSTAQARILKYYKREAEVVYPFVDLERFEQEEKPSFDVPGEFYLVVSRLVEWKKIDLAVAAFNRMGKNLIVIGNGPQKSHLISLAGSTVQVPSAFINDAQVTYLLRRARALIHPQKEDFGMTIVEANACGVPVIAYKKGGALDTIIEDETGLFFNEQTVEALVAAVKRFENETQTYASDKLKQHATRFSKKVFLQKWEELRDNSLANSLRIPQPKRNPFFINPFFISR